MVQGLVQSLQLLVLRLQQAAASWGILDKNVVEQDGLQVEALGRVSSFASPRIFLKGMVSELITLQPGILGFLGSDTTNCWTSIWQQFTSPEKPWAVSITKICHQNEWRAIQCWNHKLLGANSWNIFLINVWYQCLPLKFEILQGVLRSLQCTRVPWYSVWEPRLWWLQSEWSSFFCWMSIQDNHSLPKCYYCKVQCDPTPSTLKIPFKLSPTGDSFKWPQ